MFDEEGDFVIEDLICEGDDNGEILRIKFENLISVFLKYVWRLIIFKNVVN